MISTLCQTFQEIADSVWQLIGVADKAGLAYSEETITENLLLKFHQNHPTKVLIEAFTKYKEAKNGADWEWWIGEPGRWLGMRVQAKRIELPQENFKRLQEYQTKSQPLSQIDTLIQNARRDKLNPAYCLYIHSKKLPSLRAWPPYLIAAGGHLSQQGCFIGHAESIRAIKSNALSKIAPVIVPWHLLVCHCTGGGISYHLADWGFAALEASIRTARSLSPDTADTLANAVLIHPQEQLPAHMELVLNGGSDAERDEVLRSIAHQRNLKGFVIVKGGGET